MNNCFKCLPSRWQQIDLTKCRLSQFTMVQFTIFLLSMMKRQYAFNRNRTSNFAFWSFLGPVIYSMILFHNAGQCQWAAACSQPCDHKSKQPSHLQPFRTHTAILSFIYGIVFSTLHDRLYYTIGFVLDDSTQLQTNVTVLNTLKFALTKLWCSLG